MVRLSIAPFDAAYQTYSPGLPMVAAPDDRLTMAPPCPHWRRAMRRIAARAHQTLPSTLRSMTPRTVSAGASSRRLTPPATPALISEEHTSELQSLMRNSYAVFCSKTKNYYRNTD